MTRHPHVAGFTLMEVVVALVVSGMAVAAAAALLGSLLDRSKTAERAAVEADGDANAERLLRELVANLDAGADSAPSFEGDSQTAKLRTWCVTPHGWLDHCTAELGFEHDGKRTALRLRLEGADSGVIDIRRSVDEGHLRYLVNAESRGTWIDKWTNLGPPEAVAVILDADTLLLPVWGSYP